MANAPSIPPFEKIQIDARHENFRRFSWWAVAKFPFWAALFVWFGLTQPPLWRQLLVVAMLATGFLITLWDFVRSRQGEAARVPTSPMPRWVMFIGVFYLMLVLATGGLESPFLYVFPLLSFYTSSFAPRKLARILLVGVQIPSVLLLAAISVFELIPDPDPATLRRRRQRGTPAGAPVVNGGHGRDDQLQRSLAGDVPEKLPRPGPPQGRRGTRPRP